MKKNLAWIGVLVVALTMTFVSCSDGGGGSQQQQQGGAEPILVTFGASETVVNGGEGTTVTYDTGAYVLDYGSKDYGNVIARFKVNLGTAKLGDYEKVKFTWTGVSGDVVDYKRFYLLASAAEADVTPYKDDTAIKSVVVSSNNVGSFYDGDGPQMNGTTPIDSEFSLLKSLELTGEVWFGIYTGATDGKYKLGNVEFVPK